MAAASPASQTLQCGACGTLIVATSFAVGLGGARLVACPICSTVVTLPLPSSSSTWPCPTCTYLNPSPRATCDMCATPAAGSVSRPAALTTPPAPPVSSSRAPPPLVSRASSSSSLLPDGCSAEEEHAADALYSRVASEGRRTGVKFTDADFNPCRASLGPPASATVSMTLQEGGARRECAVPVLWRRIGDSADENREYHASAEYRNVGEALRAAVKGAGEAAGLCPREELNYMLRFLPSRVTTTAVPWTLRCGAFAPEDVVQGSLGVCWFVSALAVVCSRRDIMTRLFRHTPQLDALPPACADPDTEHIIPLPPHGCVQVRLCVDGLWRCVTIDDNVPINAITGGCAYTRCKRRQAWAPLLEKAAAKLCGSFAALASGSSGEGFRLLTGAHVESIWLRTNETDDERAARDADADAYAVVDDRLLDALWERVASYAAAAYPIGVACSCTSAAAPEAVRAGLVANHAYSVTRVAETTRGERLLQLRNPWGGSERGQWKGDWCDSSAKWGTEAGLRDRLGAFMQAETGLFWIALPDFVRFFERMDVACVPEPIAGASCTRVVVPLLQCASGVLHVLHLQPLQDMEVTIEAHTQPRGASEGSAAHVYVRDADMYEHDIGLAMVCDDPREGSTGMRLVGFSQRRFRERTSLRVRLRTNSGRTGLDVPSGGYYLVLLSMNRYADARVSDTPFVRPRDNHWAVAAVHAEGALLTELVRRPLAWLARVLVTMACSTHGSSMLSGGSMAGLGMRVMSLQERAGTVLVAVNGSPDRTLAVSHTFEAMDGVTHSRGTERVTALACEDVLQPMTACVCAVVSQHASERGGFTFNISARTADARSLPAIPSHPAGIHAPFALALGTAVRR